MGAEIKVDVSKVVDKLNKENIESAVKEALENTSNDGLNLWHSKAPIGTTGFLNSSATIQSKSDNGFELWAAEYWVYVNYGTSKMSPKPFATEISSQINSNFENHLNNSLSSKGIK